MNVADHKDQFIGILFFVSVTNLLNLIFSYLSEKHNYYGRWQCIPFLAYIKSDFNEFELNLTKQK